MSTTMKHASRTMTPSQRAAYNAVAELVRTKLLALGDFEHLCVRRDGEHVVVEQPGPPDAPDDRDPVMRLTPIGGFRFGLSYCRHTHEWERLPVSGALADVLAEAVQMLGPWLAPDPFIPGTSGMAY